MENVTPSEIHTTIQNAVALEETLRSLDQYIIRQVADAVGKHPSIASITVLDLEIDEIVQTVRVKFWQALQKTTIPYPRAYLRRMAQNAVYDVLRRREPLLPLPLDEHGELYQGRMLLTPSEIMQNPSMLIEQERFEEEHIHIIVNIIHHLPYRQRQATLWVLKDVARDVYLLDTACKALGIDLTTIQGPRTKQEVRQFRASYLIALKKLESLLDNKNTLQGVALHRRDLHERRQRDTNQRMSKHAKKQVAIIAAQEFGTDEDQLKDATLVMKHIGKLSSHYERAIRLRYEDHMTYEDIAAKLDMHVATVKSHIRWGLGKLIRSIEQEDSKKEFTSIISDVNRLKEPYRTALLLRHSDCLDYGEIARQLNVAEGTAKSYVSRGLTMLHHLITKGEHSDDQGEPTKLHLDIQAHIQELREPYQTALRLRYIEQQSYVQIATYLNVPIGTVKARISRGCKILGIPRQAGG
jgi:DNA-directed RNA polymerase specialized sigma24 family protein